LALVWRARRPATLGWAALAAALTVPISPTGLMVVAPLIVFAPRIVRILRTYGRWDAVTQALLLCCIGAVAITAMFADQTWAALVTATDWHTFFGPTLPWYHEPDRYGYLLSGDQQGSAPKRLMILLSAAMAIVAAAIALRRGRRSYVEASALRLGGVLVVALLTLALVPSKWSYHLGSVAGLSAAFLTVSVVVVWRRSAAPSRWWVPVLGAVPPAGAAALAFSGPNAWWLSTVYDLPWPTGPIRPLGVPLDNPLVWILFAALASALHRRIRRREGRRAVDDWPATITVTAAVAVVVLLLGSFLAAPVRRTTGALAVSNIQRVTGSHVCGLADDIQVLPDGPPLVSADGADQLGGFRSLTGYFSSAPPPEPPGTGASAALWGSYGTPGPASVTTRWFALPPLTPNGGVAVSVSGRADDGNTLGFEFGRSDGPEVTVLGTSTPPDRVAIDEKPDHPLWRSIGVDAAQIPDDADRVRIRATDGTDGDDSWLAFTGPRLRSVIGLNEFLADNGPVLISWPQAFVFPCVRNIVRISGGLAETPRSVIESPRPFFGEDRDSTLGGTFAGMAMFGGLNEMPTRMAGHPDIDWGTLKTAAPGVVRDAYTRSVTPEVRWGFDTTGRVGPEH
jgi:arabinosyltransferase C